MKPKIVFFDIDDTLYDRNKSVPDSAAEAVAELQRRGVITAIATGRAPFMFQKLADQLNIHTFVSINGAYVVHRDKTVYTRPLPEQPLRELVKQVRAKHWPLAYVSNHTVKVDGEVNEKMLTGMGSLKLPLPFPERDAHFWEHHPVYQMLLFYSEQDDAHFLNQEVFAPFRYVRWHEYGVDVVPKQGSKAAGISRLLKELHIAPEEACAFGDGNNDIEMLSYVGTGVAMGNAVAAAKEVATYVTGAVEEDGIYHGLKHIGLI